MLSNIFECILANPPFENHIEDPKIMSKYFSKLFNEEQHINYILANPPFN